MISFPFAKLSVRDKTAEGVFVGRMSLFCKSILLQMDCCNRPLYKYSTVIRLLLKPIISGLVL